MIHNSNKQIIFHGISLKVNNWVGTPSAKDRVLFLFPHFIPSFLVYVIVDVDVIKLT